MEDRFIIRDYIPSDNSAALQLEERCPQGNELQVSFHRRSFHQRSEMYRDYAILVGFYDDKLVAIVAGAVKEILVNGKKKRAGYFYDLRVDPEYRGLKLGITTKMCSQIIERISSKSDLIYSLVAAQNIRALKLIKRDYEPRVMIPFKYLVNPVYKKRRVRGTVAEASLEETHEVYLKYNPDLDFACSLDRERLMGYVKSFRLESSSGEAGCSVWSNKDILGERIERIPKKYLRLQQVLKLISPIMKTPHIPRPGEILDSWYVFDFYASTPASARELFLQTNNAALGYGRKYLYLPIQEDQDFFPVMKRCCWKFSPVIDYFILANGQELPRTRARIYIDIRDL